MKVYFDTGILVKSYVFEADSPEAISIIEEAGDPVIFTHLHRIEVPNAIRLKRFRGEITKEEEEEAIRVLLSDVESSRLVSPKYDLADIFERAGRLSAQHSGIIGSRSLDVLHVAAALECGCASLASFDERQRKVATRSGLALIPAARTKP